MVELLALVYASTSFIRCIFYQGLEPPDRTGPSRLYVVPSSFLGVLVVWRREPSAGMAFAVGGTIMHTAERWGVDPFLSLEGGGWCLSRYRVVYLCLKSVIRNPGDVDATTISAPGHRRIAPAVDSFE